MGSNIKVENMKSGRGREVANQFRIWTKEGVYFKSYSSIIAFRPYLNSEKLKLDRDKWDYSVTTGKYRNDFLGEDIKTTRAKIKSGEYELVDLNA